MLGLAPVVASIPAVAHEDEYGAVRIENAYISNAKIGPFYEPNAYFRLVY